MKIFPWLVCLFAWPASANVVGTHLQNFNPTTSGLDFVTVQSSQTLSPGSFNFNLFADYADDSRPFFKMPAVPYALKFSEPHDQMLTTNLGLGFGLMDGWDIGLSLPFVAHQEVDTSTQLATYDKKSLTEIRFNTKVNLFQDVSWGLALMGSANFDRIKNNPYYGGDPGPTFNLEGIFDYKFSDLLKGAFNLGYRLRDKGTIIPNTNVTPITDQILYSAAVSYLMPEWGTTFFVELYGSNVTSSFSVPTDRSLSNLEALVGAKYSIDQDYDLHAGITTQAYRGLATPDFRLYVGLNGRIGNILKKSPPAPVAIAEPPPPPPPPVEEPPSEVITLSSINFNSKSTEMTPASRAGMKKTAEQIRRNKTPLRKIIVEGHADSSGGESMNQTLSERRAQAVREALIQELQMSPDQIQAVGYGESKPLVNNQSTTGRTKNRRVELKIYRDD